MGAENHKVAWKDRLGLNRVWEQDILFCSNMFRSDGYVDAVNRFRNNMINIRDGPQLKDIVDDYVKKDLRVWREERLIVWADNNRSDARVPEILSRTEKEIDMKAHELLYNFMVQLLEDNGFCFYKGGFDGQYDEWK